MPQRKTGSMPIIEFSKEEKMILVKKIQGYLQKELDLEIGLFDAEFLLDYFSENLGFYFYNRGLYDAQVVLENSLDNITEAISEIEKPTDFEK